MKSEQTYDILKLWENYPKEMSMLLKDHTTQKNIIWATDSYKGQGEGYDFFDEITSEKITGSNATLIMPRVEKSKEEQSRRIKDKAEVFTPAWVCNAQNNLIDEAWFGRKNVFNCEVILEDGSHSWIPSEGKIEFSEEKGKTWKDYVKDMRLEITCGEAPYLASRYDAATGEIIPLERRIGLLDRKLRVVSEHTEESGDWLEWAKKALECTYGYEWQGDNLLLARESIFITVLENYSHKFGKEIPKRSLGGLAYRISWNLWQMDGLKYVIPRSCERVPKFDANLFGEFSEGENEYENCPGCKGKGEHIGIKAKVRDWKAFHEYGLKNRPKTDILFIQIVNKSQK